MKWKVLESTYLFKQPWLTVRKDKCETPGGKIIPSFYVMEYPEWANAFCLTKDGRVVMVKQYRHGLGQESIELPGGVVDEGESIEEGVKRELLEETGYRFENVEFLGKISANPSTTNNMMHMFLATGGEKVAEQNLDEEEEVEVVHMTIDDVKQLLREKKIVQSLHVNCIFYALEKLGEMRY
ncbi:MAG TPA: NUDIX hydrolase [Flavisolibacter sp.]|jgi:8-oxo-dGTP pyrophosphatase MutT (NUDIX family)|nr:NUDIX hydrolase [Flavisolibacter sp.]